MGAIVVAGNTFKEIPVYPLRITRRILVVIRNIMLTAGSTPDLERTGE